MKKKKKKQKKASDNLLVPISILNSPPVKWSNLVVVGPYLYAICGLIENAPCSNVSFLDCRTHAWREAQSLRLALTDDKFDGKLYLAGSCENPDYLNCIEVFNTKTQTWKPVPPEKRIFNGRNMEGKMLLNLNGVSSKKGLAYKPKELTGEVVGLETGFNQTGFQRLFACTIENITYCYKYNGEFV